MTRSIVILRASRELARGSLLVRLHAGVWVQHGGSAFLTNSTWGVRRPDRALEVVVRVAAGVSAVRGCLGGPGHKICGSMQVQRRWHVSAVELAVIGVRTIGRLVHVEVGRDQRRCPDVTTIHQRLWRSQSHALERRFEPGIILANNARTLTSTRQRDEDILALLEETDGQDATLVCR